MATAALGSPVQGQTAQDTMKAAHGSFAGSYEAFYASHPWVPRLVGAQFTFFGQLLLPFAAPYSGAHSLTPGGDHQATHTYGVYLGSRPLPGFEVYADFEMARGGGIGHALGLGGITNGDVIRQGSANLGQGPYLARLYGRYVIPLTAARDTPPRGQDQLPIPEPSTGIEIKAGKFALSDDFDQNRYANLARYQFENWALWNNTAWDFAADTRGYTNGVVLGYVSPPVSFRFAAVQMPTFANGNVFDDDIAQAHGLNAELTLSMFPSGTVVRILGYQNRARMGIYRHAIEIAQATGTSPNIVADDSAGRVKYGFGINVEQSLADSGNTGVFLRLGWNDGKTEDFVFTEVDRHLSAGLQLAGTSWHRAEDRIGIALVVHGISEDHADYLAAGGLGFLLGDGRLTYGVESIAEFYYRFTVPTVTFIQISPDYQFVLHPGYNRVRGPAHVLGIRVNAHW